MIHLRGKIAPLARCSAAAAVVLVAARLISGCSSTNSGSSTDAGDAAPAPAGKLSLQITTGGDSLRLDSGAGATVIYKDGSQDVIALDASTRLGDGGAQQNFSAGSTRTITADLSSAQPIDRIQIALASDPGLFETSDSWTIDEVRATVSYGASSPGQCVLDRPGAAITDGKPLVLTPGGCTNGGGLTLVVVTGGDDLRSDSTATVTVAHQGGASNTTALTQSFRADTTMQVAVGLTSADPIERITFKMQSHPSGLEGADNWDIRQVEVLVGDADGGSPMCIIDALGKTITDGVDLTVTPGGCPVMTPDGGADGGLDDGGDEASADAATD
jgi:hypothetical protein